MMEQPMLIPVEQDLLVADIHLGSDVAVVLLPGWSGTRYGPQRILYRTAEALAQRRFTTLRLDFRGRGDATGSAETVTLDGMIADAQAAIAWLQEKHLVSRIHLVGICSGGNVALGVASLMPQVERVVCWSLLPFMEHKQQTNHSRDTRASKLHQLVRKALRPATWGKLLRGEANIRGAIDTVAKDKEGDAEEQRRKTSRRDILADLSTFAGRLHLVYGGSDPEAVESERFFTNWCRMHGIPCEVGIIPGAPHTFFTASWTDEVITRTVQWISES